MDIFGTLDGNGDHIIDENEWMHGARTLAMSTFAGMCQTDQCDSCSGQARTSIDEDANLMLMMGTSLHSEKQDAAKTSVQELKHTIAVLQDKLRVFQEQAASYRGQGASQVEGGSTIGKTEVEKVGPCANPNALPEVHSSDSYSLNPYQCNLTIDLKCPAHYCTDTISFGAPPTGVDTFLASSSTMCYYRPPVQYVYPTWTSSSTYECKPVLPPVASNFYGWSGSQLSFHCPTGKGSKGIGVRGDIYGPHEGSQHYIWDHFANVPPRMRPATSTSTAGGAKRMSSAGQPVQDYDVTVFPAGFIEFHPPVNPGTHSYARFEIDVTWTLAGGLGCSCGFCDENLER